MLDTYIKNKGMTKTIIHNNNRNSINETNWDVDYDGSVANVSLDFSKNGKNKQHIDFEFTNDDLASIFNVPSVSKPIHKRLKTDFRKPESFKQVFLELEPESESDFYGNNNNNNISSSIPELLTHISSPKSNEEFVMPFQDYSLDNQPVIKIVNRPLSKSSKRNTHKHHNYPSTRKSSRHHNYPSTRKSSRRRKNSRRS